MLTVYVCGVPSDPVPLYRRLALLAPCTVVHSGLKRVPSACKQVVLPPVWNPPALKTGMYKYSNMVYFKPNLVLLTRNALFEELECATFLGLAREWIS